MGILRAIISLIVQPKLDDCTIPDATISDATIRQQLDLRRQLLEKEKEFQSVRRDGKDEANRLKSDLDAIYRKDKVYSTFSSRRELKSAEAVYSRYVDGLNDRLRLIHQECEALKQQLIDLGWQEPQPEACPAKQTSKYYVNGLVLIDGVIFGVIDKIIELESGLSPEMIVTWLEKGIAYQNDCDPEDVELPGLKIKVVQ